MAATIEENIKTGLRAKGFPKDEIEQKTNDMMKRFHIEELAKRYPIFRFCGGRLIFFSES